MFAEHEHAPISSLITTLLIVVLFCGCTRDETSEIVDATSSKTILQSEPSSSAESEPAPSAKQTQAVDLSNASTSETTKADATAKTTQAKPAPPTPKPIVDNASAEQIAQWAIPEHADLELLECFDEFADNNIRQMAVSEDGTRFAIAGSRLTLWTLGDSKPTVDFVRHSSGNVSLPISAVDISRDGTLLAAGEESGMLRIWKTDDNTEILATQAYDRRRILHVKFSPDAKTLVTTDYSGAIKIWDVERGRELSTLTVDKNELKALEFVSPTSVVCVGNETTIWNIETREKQTLSEDRIRFPGVSITPDGDWLAYADEDAELHFWDLNASQAGTNIDRCVGSIIDFSPDGKLIATYGHESQIEIWSRDAKQKVQVIDADGTQVVGLKWLPQGLLLLANNGGRIRIWGTPENAERAGMKRLVDPIPMTFTTEDNKPAYSAQLLQVLDLRSMPRLPNRTQTYESVNALSYLSPCTFEEALAFHRHILSEREWLETEDEPTDRWQFHRGSFRCELVITGDPARGTSGDGGVAKTLTQVTLYLSDGCDVREFPQFPERTDEKSQWGSSSNDSYQTAGDFADIEAFTFKELHAQGWTAYSRPDTSYHETPDESSLSFIQGGTMLSVWIRQAGLDGNRSVSLSTTLTNRSLPIPPDCGLVEYTNSVEQELVATTKMRLDETVAFYDRAMKEQGWLARESGRRVDDEENQTATLVYIRGQQDLKIRLAVLENGETRILVGDVESSSWQLEKPDPVPPEILAIGLQAADYPFPEGSTRIKFEVDEQEIEFCLTGESAAKAVEACESSLESLGWIRNDSGIRDDDYALATFEKQDISISIRARPTEGKLVDVNVEGRGLLWSKALPVKPVRVAYQTWLRRNKFTATLDRLDQFVAEMKKLEKPSVQP
ncbi:MAG: WD40 repeat domain-containing protein [Pirellulaceae bacterium]